MKRKPNANGMFPRQTDDAYVALDDAIGALLHWWPELITALADRGISEVTLQEVRAAMNRVHDGDYNEE